MLEQVSQDAWAHPRPRYFDIGTGFEHYMSIIPALIFVLSTPIHLSPASEIRVLDRKCAHIYLQIVLLTALASTEIQVALIWVQKTTYGSATTIAEGALLALVSGCAAFIVDSGRTRPPLPRPFIGKFYYLASMLDLLRAPVLHRRSAVIAQWTLVCSILKFGVALLEQGPEKSTSDLNNDASYLSPLILFYKRSLVQSLSGICQLGFKDRISIEDLPDMDPEAESSALYSRFQHEWRKVYKKTEYSLVETVASAIQWDIISCLTPRLLAAALSLARPLMFHRILYIAGQPDQSLKSLMPTLAATIVVFLSHAFARSYCQSLGIKNASLYRSCLTTAIYDKMLRLQDTVLQRLGPLNVLTADIEAVENAVMLFNDLWCAALTTFLGTWLLLQQLQNQFFMVFIPVSCYALIAYILLLYIAPAEQASSQGVKGRVSNTLSLLHHWTTIKIGGMAPVFENLIKLNMSKELKGSISLRQKLAVFYALVRVIEPLSCTMTVGMALFYAKGDSSLTTADIFTIISLVAILNKPIICTINGFGRLESSLESFQRIQNFLIQPELYDGRQVESHRKFGIKMQHVVAGGVPAGRKMVPNLRATFGNRLTTMIVGAVGSGKTTLIKILAGETPMAFGNITLNSGSIAYCSQDPWLRNISIRENIIGDAPLDMSWYYEVLRICHLEADIAGMPEGDSALAGTHGRHLKLCLRQRIALARAIYSRSTIYLLDDVFNSLDRATAYTVFQNLFGARGYLKSHGKTVLMTTNIVEHLPAAHVVLQLDDAGNLCSIEDADKLVERGFLRWETELAEPGTAVPTPTTGAVKTPRNAPAAKERLRSKDAMVSNFYTTAIGKRKWNLFLGLLVVGSLCDKLPHILVKVNAITNVTDIPHLAILWISALTPSIIWLIAFKLWYRHWTLSVVEELHSRLLHKILRFPIAFVSSIDARYFIKCFFEDISVLNDELPGVISATSMAFFALVFDICLFSSSSIFAPVAIGIPAYCAVSIVRDFYLKVGQQVQCLELEARAPFASLIIETIHGIQQIRTCKWEAKYKTQSKELLGRSQKLVYNVHRLRQFLYLATDFVATAVAVAAIVVGMYGTPLASELAASLGMATIFTFGDDAAVYIDGLLKLSSASSSVSRLQFICDSTPTDLETEMPLGDASQFSQWSQEGDIEFRDVSTGYKLSNEISISALHNINVHIRPGLKVGLSGLAGCGKTSVLLTLLRFLDYTGSITIDGIELSSIPCELIRTRITTIPRDILELPGSLRFNLDPLADDNPETAVSDELMINTLTEVGLWETFVRQKQNLDSIVAEMALTRGQKQLLSLARAIIHHRHTQSKIVLVDELVPYLDLATELQMQELMCSVFSTSTMLFVSQKEEIMSRMDVIAEMSQGRMRIVVDRRQQTTTG